LHSTSDVSGRKQTASTHDFQTSKTQVFLYLEKSQFNKLFEEKKSKEHFLLWSLKSHLLIHFFF